MGLSAQPRLLATPTDMPLSMGQQIGRASVPLGQLVLASQVSPKAA